MKKDKSKDPFTVQLKKRSPVEATPEEQPIKASDLKGGGEGNFEAFLAKEPVDYNSLWYSYKEYKKKSTESPQAIPEEQQELSYSLSKEKRTTEDIKESKDIVLVNVSEEFPYVAELISNHFTDLWPVIETHDNVLIYGGALRDIVAGLDPVDVDLICLRSDTAIKSFSSNTRWAVDKKVGGSNSHNIKFRNIHSKIADITLCMDSSPVPIIKRTDLLCCCLIMDVQGNLYEAVPGAIQDCKDRILRLNPSCTSSIDKNRLLERIIKLGNRGWKSVIDLSLIPDKKIVSNPVERTKTKPLAYGTYNPYRDKEAHKSNKWFPWPAPEQHESIVDIVEKHRKWADPTENISEETILESPPKRKDAIVQRTLKNSYASSHSSIENTTYTIYYSSDN